DAAVQCVSSVCSPLLHLCVLLLSEENYRVFGAEVDMRVKAGDSITLYCDCVIPLGSLIVWFRNCSHEHQPSLFIDSTKIFKEKFPRFSFVLNGSRNSYDLHITNVSVSDEGIYYCAKTVKKISKDVNGIINNQFDSRNSYDLHITNVSVSDEGIYYCAKTVKKISKDVNGIINNQFEYEYGNKTTRLSVLGEKTFSLLFMLICFVLTNPLLLFSLYF
uniref:Ig-like domain-containing protein n=1 Tax=Sinocyclocheilus grahami TaxID=75366 RepID=A0A672LTP5_SINGR